MKRTNKVLALLTLLIFTLTFSSCSKTKVTSSNANENTLKVHYIDVGQGDSILIQVNNKNLLIDAGPNSSTSKLMDYLKSQNIKKLDYVVATHPDEDHIGGMDSIIKKYQVTEFIAPKITKNTKTFESMLNALKSKNLKITTAKPDLTLDLGEKVSCKTLAPNSDKYEKTNNYSVVIKLTYGNNSFLFTGDAEKESEREMLSKKYNLSADVLKVGHHGSSSSSSKEFLDKVSPKIAVISLGKGNDYGHPHKETLNEVKKRNIQMYRTDIDGTIILESNGKTITKH